MQCLPVVALICLALAAIALLWSTKTPVKYKTTNSVIIASWTIVMCVLTTYLCRRGNMVLAWGMVIMPLVMVPWLYIVSIVSVAAFELK